MKNMHGRNPYLPARNITSPPLDSLETLHTTQYNMKEDLIAFGIEFLVCAQSTGRNSCKSKPVHLTI